MIIQELEDHEIRMQDRYEKLEKKLILSGSENSVMDSKETVASSTADNAHYPSRKRLNRQDSQNLIEQEHLQQKLFQQQVLFESFKRPINTTVADNGDSDNKHPEKKVRVNTTSATSIQQADNSASDSDNVTSEEELDSDNENEHLKLAKAISLSHSLSGENNGEEEIMLGASGSQQNSAISTSSVGSTTSTALPAQYSEGVGVVGFFPVPTQLVSSDSQSTSPTSSPDTSSSALP